MSIYNKLNTENYGSSTTESGCFCKKNQPCGYESDLYDNKNWCYTSPGYKLDGEKSGTVRLYNKKNIFFIILLSFSVALPFSSSIGLFSF